MEERGVVALLEKAKQCAKVEEQLRILHKRNDRLEDEVLEAQVAVERKVMEAVSIKDQWQSTILSRVHTGLLSWAFVTWSAAASVQREDIRRVQAELAVRHSMKQFHTQVAVMSTRLENLTGSPVSVGSPGSDAAGERSVRSPGGYDIAEGTPPRRTASTGTGSGGVTPVAASASSLQGSGGRRVEGLFPGSQPSEGFR